MRFKLLCINLVFKLLDLFTTFWAVQRVGEEIEANPIMKYAIKNLGNWAYLWNFFVFLLAILLLYRKNNIWPLVIVSLMMLAVVINNILWCLSLAGAF
jgi:hypothetical protein